MRYSLVLKSFLLDHYVNEWLESFNDAMMPQPTLGEIFRGT